jgi:hypothetical protein
MYGPHTAREDTVLFPAWKAALGAKGYDEMGDQFENLEHKMLGEDGFEDALGRVSKIELAFGLAELTAVTAPPPPSAVRNNQGLNPGIAPGSPQVALPARITI